ncbi:type II secretion system (T2SS), F family protein [Chlamydia ibidis]|uniref:Type II secretion system (T2SS), F family protein n=2 Tax=Chlamydia ibidis TaxID=1405396 RepID=S7J233_9CHLA|nr:type II secretion system F family protein [Chlamydia ibidis]EPP34484.1 type II secretion system (T2SS), F family protein [Chlamydia ibidis]EQM62237.1 bacterial type II secretion system F domain protein [Chlamydia ibidis 10-1398/6]
MPRYRYTYLNEKEQKRRGYLEALHIQEAREKLKESGKHFLSIREVAIPTIRVSNAEKIVFSKQLLLLLKSGLPLYETLSALRDQYQGQPMASLLTSFMNHLRSGGALSEVLASYPRIFDNFYCSGVMAGERVGNLEGALENIIGVLEEREQVTKKMWAALSYPIVLIGFSVLVILFFLMGVIPSLKETFDSIELNGITYAVFGISDFVCSYGYLLLVGVCVCFGFAFITRNRSFWKRGIERFIFAFPGLKNFFVKVGFSRFCSVVSAILRGGGTLIEGLELGCHSIPYEFLRNDMETVVHSVIGGNALSHELRKKKWVPQLALGMISLGEESGELADVLGYIANIYNEDTQKTLSWITSWCQPVILVVLGGVIGVIMLAVLIPLTSNIQTL